MRLPYPENKSGFTMLEMIVSVAIIAFVSSIFLANYHGTNRKSELNLVAQKMVSDIRMAQNYSLSTKEFKSGVPALGGWGIRASTTASNKNHYILFADKNNNGDYDSGETFKKIDLPNGIVVSGITVNNVPASPLRIVFLPPDPATYINGTPNVHTDISLKDKDGNAKVVTVNYLGLADVDDTIIPTETCTLDSDCTENWCNAGVCMSPWIASAACPGFRVYKNNSAGLFSSVWSGLSQCDPPQCSIVGAQLDRLVADNSVNFSSYPARNLCKAIGGRLPSRTELSCIYQNRAIFGTYGGFVNGQYWSSDESFFQNAYIVSFMSPGGGAVNIINRANAYAVRCVK